MFYDLLFKITPFIRLSKIGQISSRNSSGSFISSEVCLAVTLRYVAEGSYPDICFAFGIGHKGFFKENFVLWKTMNAINKVLSQTISFPLNDRCKLQCIEEEFSEFSFNRLRGVLWP